MQKHPAPAPIWCCFRSWDSRPTPAMTCFISRPCSMHARPRSRRWCDASARLVGARDRRAAAARRSAAVQLRGAGRRRPAARRGAEDLSAELRRVLRSAPVRRRRQRTVARDRSVRRARAVRCRPDLSVERAAAAQDPRRDLRRRLGAAAAVELRRAGRRDGARQPVRIEHHDRQIRLPASARGSAVGALPRGLPLLVGRHRRIDHRSGVGRPGADLRMRRSAGRERTLRQRVAPDHRRRRPRAARARAHAPDHVRRQRAQAPSRA